MRVISTKNSQSGLNCILAAFRLRQDKEIAELENLNDNALPSITDDPNDETAIPYGRDIRKLRCGTVGCCFALAVAHGSAISIYINGRSLYQFCLDVDKNYLILGTAVCLGLDFVCFICDSISVLEKCCDAYGPGPDGPRFEVCKFDHFILERCSVINITC